MNDALSPTFEQVALGLRFPNLEMAIPSGSDWSGYKGDEKTVSFKKTALKRFLLFLLSLCRTKNTIKNTWLKIVIYIYMYVYRNSCLW